MHPLLTRESPVHDAAFKSLAALNATHVRFASWFPFPRLSNPEMDAPSGLQQCGDVGAGYDVRLSCARGGGVINAVQFASFGLPDGACGAFTRSAQCHAANSSAVVEALCLGQRECTIPASAQRFGGSCNATAQRLAVQVTCDPPQNNTYWDFRYLDPVVEDFMAATGAGVPLLNFCTMPSWLYDQSGQPVHHAPDRSVGTDWGYETGVRLLDPTCTQVGEWYGRLAGWYINGGFTDEFGAKHVGGHRYPIRMWEVLNEVLHEHSTSIKEYICIYDAVVTAIRAMADPAHLIEFAGMAYANVDVTFFDDFRVFPQPLQPSPRHPARLANVRSQRLPYAPFNRSTHCSRPPQHSRSLSAHCDRVLRCGVCVPCPKVSLVLRSAVTHRPVCVRDVLHRQ